MKNIKLKWVLTLDELPKPNTLVIIKRNYNGRESIYLGMRNNKPLSDSCDPSKNCHWHGNNIDQVEGYLGETINNNLHFESNFSDITVVEWSYLFSEHHEQ